MPLAQGSTRPPKRNRGRPRAIPGIPDIAPYLDTLSDARRRLGSLASGIGADEFAVLLLETEGGQRRFVPSIDSAIPGHVSRTSRYVEVLGDRIMRRVVESALPFWWSNDPTTLTASSLAACAWAEEISAPAMAGSALALPLQADRNAAGLVLFPGDRLSLRPTDLTDVHAQCLEVFALVAHVRPAATELPAQMSRREVECLKLTANGCTSEEIAERLGLSVHTANQYVTNALQKLDAVSRVHAVAKAMRLGLID